MPLSHTLDSKIRNRFDELVEELETLLADLDEYSQDHALRFEEWVIKCSALLTMVFGESKQGEKYVDFVERNHGPGFHFGDGPYQEIVKSSVQSTLATLKGIRNNYVNGFYVGLETS